MTENTATARAELWRSEFNAEPAELAGVFDAAAAILAAGWDKHGDDGPTIRGALAAAAAAHLDSMAQHIGARAEDDAAWLANELELRLAGVLYVCGKATKSSNIRDLNQTAADFEHSSDHFNGVSFEYHTQAEVVCLLKMAAVMTAAAGMSYGA
jgi:hypothetical protein